MNENIVKGKVVSITGESTVSIPGTSLTETKQFLKVSITENGVVRTVDVLNSHTSVKSGTKVYIEKTENLEAPYTVVEIARTNVLAWALILFAIVTVWVGRKQGVRGLISLLITIFILFSFLIPQLLKGNNSFLLIIGTTFCITIISAFVTHGKNKATYAAVLGMCTTLIITGILTMLAFNWANMTGFADESSVYFAASQNAPVNIRALFLGSVLIGLLGILYDAAISQAVYVAETIRLNPNLKPREIVKSALHIGREHIGALVDTLAVVSIGASLIDTLLIIQNSVGPLGMILSREMVSSHILQILIGSIGVILAVPITTYLASFIIRNGDIVSTKFHSHNGHYH